MAEGDTLVNAVIGAVVGVVAGSFIPFGTVVGGAAAGYLQGGDRQEALRVGAISGGLMLVPMVLFMLVFGPVFFFTFMGGMWGSGGAAFGGLAILFFLIALVVGLIYTVGLGAVGGYLGNYVKYDTDIDL